MRLQSSAAAAFVVVNSATLHHLLVRVNSSCSATFGESEKTVKTSRLRMRLCEERRLLVFGLFCFFTQKIVQGEVKLNFETN